MVKVIENRKEIEALEFSNNNLKKQIICELLFSKDIFREVRQVLNPASENSFWAVRVIDKQENVLFYLKYEEDRFTTLDGSYVVETNYDGEKLIDEVDNLDLSIIENYDQYIFSNIDEYTYAIAELILDRYCDKNIVFFCAKAKFFFNDERVTCIRKADYKNDSTKRTMYVSSNAVRYDVRPFTDVQVNVFSCIMVIANLCWARKRQNRGELNKDKTIVVIDYSPTLKMGGMGGMNAIIWDVLYYCSKAVKNGWVPVVHLTNTQYMSNCIEDCWSYYFEGLSEISYEEAMQSAHVIDGRENHFTWLPQRLLIDAKLENQFEVNFSEQMCEYINKNMPRQFNENKRILGVIARGSDLKKAKKADFSIDDFVREVKAKYKDQYDYIFLATEEAEYLKMFCEEFNEKIIYVEQKRINYDYDNNGYRLIADVLDLKDDERTEFGRKYLFVTYLLAKCDGLYSTIGSGARSLARRWRKDAFEFDEIYYDNQNNSNVEMYLERTNIQMKITQFIENHEKVIIYGIGRDVKSYVPNISGNKIVYCDKKAKEHRIVYREHDVISPDKLGKFRGIPIIISSTLFGTNIKEELLEKGINEESIFLINDFSR